MALIVEDGTNVPNADSLASLEAADARLSALGDAGWAADSVENRESALRRGTLYLTMKYQDKWKGERTHGRDQVWSWPRKNVYDAEGYLIPSDEIPPEVVNAVIEAAARERRKPNSLLPDYVPGRRIESVTAGPVSVKFTAGSVVPEISTIWEILSGLLISSSSRMAYLERV